MKEGKDIGIQELTRLRNSPLFQSRTLMGRYDIWSGSLEHAHGRLDGTFNRPYNRTEKEDNLYEAILYSYISSEKAKDLLRRQKPLGKALNEDFAPTSFKLLRIFAELRANHGNEEVLVGIRPRYEVFKETAAYSKSDAQWKSSRFGKDVYRFMDVTAQLVDVLIMNECYGPDTAEQRMVELALTYAGQNNPGELWNHSTRRSDTAVGEMFERSFYTQDQLLLVLIKNRIEASRRKTITEGGQEVLAV